MSVDLTRSSRFPVFPDNRTSFDYLCTDRVDVAIEALKEASVLRGGFSVQ
jgi:hypothetical protein